MLNRLMSGNGIRYQNSKIVAALLVSASVFLTGCSFLLGDNENPLYGKSTEERVLMSLEETYPEHDFHVITPIETKVDGGIFADENGLEFKVNHIYDVASHFQCYDQYLYEVLCQQEYVQKVEDILKKYDLEMVTPAAETDVNDVIGFCLTYEEGVDTLNAANAVKEILNCVEVPTVVYPETGFSSFEAKYYSIPQWALFTCDITDPTINSIYCAKFYFEDKDETVENLAKRIDDEVMETRAQKEFYGGNLEGTTEEESNSK